MTAMAIQGMMSPNYAMAEQVSFNDPDLIGDYAMYPSPIATAKCARIGSVHWRQLAPCSLWPAFEAALKAADTRNEALIHPGANHGFHNDSTPYDQAAAELAGSRTVDFFQANLV